MMATAAAGAAVGYTVRCYQVGDITYFTDYVAVRARHLDLQGRLERLERLHNVQRVYRQR